MKLRPWQLQFTSANLDLVTPREVSSHQLQSVTARPCRLLSKPGKGESWCVLARLSSVLATLHNLIRLKCIKLKCKFSALETLLRRSGRFFCLKRASWGCANSWVWLDEHKLLFLLSDKMALRPDQDRHECLFIYSHLTDRWASTQSYCDRSLTYTLWPIRFLFQSKHYTKAPSDLTRQHGYDTWGQTR